MASTQAADPIYVVGPGLVGSHTVLSSLQSAGLDAVLVLHFGPDLDWTVRTYGAAVMKPSKLQRSLDLERAVRTARLTGRRINLVCTLRDPIERVIEGLFDKFEPGALDRRCEAEGADAVAAELGRRLAAVLPRRLAVYGRWYGETLPWAIGSRMPPIGKDGYLICETPLARCLFIPIEHFDRLGAALSAFAGRAVAVIPAETSANQDAAVADLSRRIGRAVPLGPLGLSLVYGQAAMTAAYQPEELARFRRRWGFPPLPQRLAGDLRYLRQIRRG